MIESVLTILNINLVKRIVLELWGWNETGIIKYTPNFNILNLVLLLSSRRVSKINENGQGDTCNFISVLNNDFC